MQQRRFHRITFSAPGELSHHGLTYQVRLQNISLRGALLASDECLLVPVGDSCTLALSLPGEPPVLITAQAVHTFFSMLGIKFVGFTAGAEQRLYALLKNITSQADLLEEEWHVILRH
ncbi:MAG TPA: PilZ domain-containing protein [Geomonas sp.]|nr:PilZ domain-containing protein [Geomonas sp.]